jgi:Ca-activated chloride channel family protein
MVAEANAKGGLPQPIVAVYPREGTFWSDHPVGVVDRDWVGPEERDAAERYIAFLLARPQQEKALKHGFRPADVDVPLGSTFARPGLDPGEPKTTLRVPEAKVLAAVLQLWTRAKKRADVALVLDISGSMQGEKLAKAQAGARQLAAMLGEGDRLSLLVFSDRLHWMLEDLAMPAGLPRVERVLGGLQAAGGTAVYDAVAAAYGRLQERAPAGVNTAVVALTDGQDNRSRQALDALVASLAASGPREVRVFAIGYGKDASLPAMQRIAEATRARAYEGDPVTIEKVFFDLATFF